MSKTNAVRFRKRGSERRKEKSREAARYRRSKEADIFALLADQLPDPCVLSTTHGQIDKATIMRLSLSMLKLRALLHGIDISDDFARIGSYDGLEVVESFLMIVSKDGDILFVSDNVCQHLGIPQVELVGQSLYEFSHPCEQEVIKSLLMEKTLSSATFRMKATNAAKGRNVNLKSASYKVIQCHGHYISSAPPTVSALILLCDTLPEISDVAKNLNRNSFITQHSLNMKIVCCDKHITPLLGYEESDAVGMSMYEMYHSLDTEQMGDTFKDLFVMGQAKSAPYRLLAKSGGYVWATTLASLQYDDVRGKPTSVVCQHEVLSEISYPKQPLSLTQLEQCKSETEIPVFSTEKVMCPWSDLSDEELEASSKFDVDADNLLDLAPDAGDVCIPLDFPDLQMLLTIPLKIGVGIAEAKDEIRFAGTNSRRQQTFATGPVVSPIKWEPLSVDTSCSGDSAPISLEYPASEGFTMQCDSVSSSPHYSGFDSPVSLLGSDSCQFSPLFDGKEDNMTLDQLSNLKTTAHYIPIEDDWMLNSDTVYDGFTSVSDREVGFMSCPTGPNYNDPMMTDACLPSMLAKRPMTSTSAAMTLTPPRAASWTSLPSPVLTKSSPTGRLTSTSPVTLTPPPPPPPSLTENSAAPVLNTTPLHAIMKLSSLPLCDFNRMSPDSTTFLFTELPQSPRAARQNVTVYDVDCNLPLKIAKTENQTTPEETSRNVMTSGSSVLMSLLTCGEDKNYGYSLAQSNAPRSVSAASPSVRTRLASLPRIAQYDAEVNAPIAQPNLLTGKQLLDALDSG